MRISGIEKAMAALAKKIDAAGTGSYVEIGWKSDARYPSDDKHSGQSVASIAIQNEYGDDSNITKPARETTIYRSVNKKTGNFNQGARFVTIPKSNYATDHNVPEYNIVIPPRPFFRNMIRKNSANWMPRLNEHLAHSKFDGKKALAKLGEEVVGQLQDSIEEFSDPANAPSTIAKKGFNDPLVESGTMLRSVDKWVT